MENVIVAAITCTRGRHSLLERCVGNYLKQDYKGKSYQIIFNNSPHRQKLDTFYIPSHKKILLVNQHIDVKTGKPYESINRIFEDAMARLPYDVQVVTFFDDDDVFLPHHISEGVREWIEGGKKAYKPYYSLCQTSSGIEKTHNMCEPSFFVEKEHVLRYGFSPHSSAYHHQWINPLIQENQIYEPIDGTPTFVYQWVGGCYHISGDGDNPENLANHNKNSVDEGDGIITPIY